MKLELNSKLQIIVRTTFLLHFVSNMLFKIVDEGSLCRLSTLKQEAQQFSSVGSTFISSPGGRQFEPHLIWQAECQPLRKYANVCHVLREQFAALSFYLGDKEKRLKFVVNITEFFYIPFWEGTVGTQQSNYPL